ncbi:hypothetical protein AVEN_255210-1 [Araneus ventricosus]|uniref:Uncharacterized protein n=1 Tax=Araneus ventricosus TaxID=182803 RepID=A0A4Y2B9P3_ARAVE|nr:hypothetical protein AVEN_255210-1 [Araneus ventricosus]
MDISEYSENLNDALNHHTGETKHHSDASSDNESVFEYNRDESSTSSYQDDNVSFDSDSDAHFEDVSSNELNFDDLSQPLYSSSSITNSEAFISILAFIIRFNLSQTCVQELLNFLLLLLPPNNFPNTRYLIFKQISPVFDNICEVHLYCKDCNYNLSEFLAQNKPNVCPSCDEVPFNAEESIRNGEVAEKGRGTCLIYDVVKGSLPQLRFHDQTVEDVSVATEKTNPFKGVKGPSLLMKLYPHLINGFVPDFMHAVLLDVTRQIVNIWIETLKLTYSVIGKSVKKLNERIHHLKIPSETVRCLRSTKDISFWKAPSYLWPYLKLKHVKTGCVLFVV